MSVVDRNQSKPAVRPSSPALPMLRPVCQAIALMLATGASMSAHAATNLASIGAQISAARNAAGATGVRNLGMSPQQALQASQPSIQNLAHAAQGIAQQIAAQQAAAVAGIGAASNVPNVPNGLTPGGLQVAPGVSTDAKNNPNLWINASAPGQTVDANGHVTVEVDQTAQNAVATWQTMNVGAQTTLYFNQSAGTQSNGANNWVILNRIMDPSGAPSQILGNIKAQGSVFVINRNGILFGAGSQVNVHSLIASSLDLLDASDVVKQGAADIEASNQLFLSLPLGTQGGLAALEAGSTQSSSTPGVANEVLGLGNKLVVNSPTDYILPGSVTIAPGASITTQTNGTVSDGGFVLVAAPNVTNSGSITANDGQVVLAAGVGVSFKANLGNPQQLIPELSGQIAIPTGQFKFTDVTPAGTLINTGIVQATRGNINLLGSSVQQNGVVGVTTSVNTPGTITISTVDEYTANTPTGAGYSGQTQITNNPNTGGNDTHRAGLLSFGPDSVTTVMPDADGATATSAPGTVFTAGSIGMTAGSVWFQGGSLIEAPGSSVSVAALTPSAALNTTPPGDTAVPGRIYLDTGATIDVSGLTNVELPIADTLVTVPRIGQNELADSPLLRNGFLFGLTNVVFDSTLTGTRSDGVQWVGSPILNLSGYVSLIPRSIDQLLINGGAITLSGNEVMTATGSSLNLNGGYIHYDGGMVNTTRLVDANGAIVPIGQADPNDNYVGVAGEFVESHPRWQITKDWFDPLVANGGTFEPDFIVGGDAGTLSLFASTAMVLDGDITALAFSGSKQVQGGDQAVGGTFNLGANPAIASGKINLAGLTQGSNSSQTGETGTIILQNGPPQLSDITPNFSIDTPIDVTAQHALAATDPNNVLANTVVPTDTLSAGGFANVSLTENGTNANGYVVPQDAQLKVQPGGTISLKGGPTTTVLGNLIAPSGAISISASTIVVGPDATISAAGQWINNDTQQVADSVPGGSEFINGGSVTLSAGSNIDLQAGSLIDVSSGGELQANGQLLMKNGIPVGEGGNVSLITFATLAGFPDLPADNRLAMDGTIRSEGFAGGGTLTLQAPGFQIGGDPAAAHPWDVVLPADYFEQQGFGSYVLNALFDAGVAAGSTVRITQQNFIPNVAALQQAATGADLWTGGLTSLGSIDPFDRQPTNFVMTGGGVIAATNNLPPGANPPIPAYGGDAAGVVSVGEGASVIADAGAKIGLASPTQVTVLGSLIAPDGTIVLSADTTGSADPSVPVLPGQFTGHLFTTDSKSVWLGADAVLDVAGTALTDPFAAPVRNGLSTVIPNTGKVLPGGSVTISDDSGYIVAQAGARIDVSGAAATLDALQANGQYASQPVWSDAGSITLRPSSGLLFDGTIEAHGGAAQAEGGTLEIVPNADGGPAFGILGAASTLPGVTALIIEQSGTRVPAGLAPGQSFVTAIGAPTGVVQFSADRLDGSGITTLELGDPVGNTSTAGVGVAPIAFAGDVNLNLSRAVIFDTGNVTALSDAQLSSILPSGSTGAWLAPATTLLGLLTSTNTGSGTNPGTDTAADNNVTVNAPYVALVGPTLGTALAVRPLSQMEALGNGVLNVNASFIDLVNQVQLSEFGEANFTSSGDIRLSSTSASLATGGPNALEAGELVSPGNLSFKAADLYPSTGTTFIIAAVGPTTAGSSSTSTGSGSTSTGSGPTPTTITFESNGASSVPLSAGGTLLVDATDIVQGGTVRAPSGSLIFGVGDPTDAATLAQFNNLVLTATNTVSFASGSLTSVSTAGAVIPYGTTVDGVEWQFNPVPGLNAAPDVTAPPAKFVSANGSSVSLNAGATIDLSGGGDLQASEWVAGTGGTRDVLSQYTVSFASNASGTAVPVNVGASNVYAILPGKQSPVAAYDPVFAQTVQPSTNSSGASTATKSIGVGQASLSDAAGQSVYLSGVPGLPAGFYTLLPGKYATLPGAFRVTMSSASGAVTPGASQTLPDGTVAVAGYFGDALTGSRSVTPTLFDVQSGQVWQQYSQYTLSSANAFFPTSAAQAGTIAPPLPIDAGHLVLAAGNALALGAKLDTAAGDGGAPAEVDIASQDIQIVGNGEAALQGYLQISADALDALGAGSLLIGGTRTQTTTGITIDPIANSVVVSNDAANPLSGPEVMLATKTDASGTDANAANGLRIDAGSVIQAQGAYPAAKDVPITIGVAPDSSGHGGVSGDGALLSVSNGANAVVTRLDTTPAATNAGSLTVSEGATLTGGQALTLDASGTMKFDPTASFSGSTIAVDSSAITFTDQAGEAAASLPGFVISAPQLAQLSNTQELVLRSAGAMNFDGSIEATFGSNVDLSAGTFVSDGGTATLNGKQIAFTNEVGAPAAAGTGGSAGTVGSGTLTVNANEIDFGTGDKLASGFGSATFNATGGIVGQGTGTFDFGAAPVTFSAPVYLADTGSQQTLKTTGALNLNAAAGTALPLVPIGGALSFTGSTLSDNGATIEAPSGNISLEATTGDLTVASGSLISVAGVAKDFFNITVFAPAGAITLTADQGTANIQAGSTLDFSGAQGLGKAGSLTLSAPEQIVNLNGTLKGMAGPNALGGSFTLNTGGAVDLDSLAAELATSGVNNVISVETHAGNLTLSAANTLTAHQVSLTADGGAGGQDTSGGVVTIDGTINASGAAGGEIDLYGRSKVDIEGTLLAMACLAGNVCSDTQLNPAQRGGTVNIGTRANPDTVGGVVQLDPTSGYESVSSANSGWIVLGAGAQIDVSGGTAGGLSNGTVNFRAPLLSNGDVNVTVDAGAQIRGSRATTLEAYAVWSTDDPLTNGGAQHFDGVVDPAGWYNDTTSGAGEPGMVAGTWTDQSGNALAAPTAAQLADYLENDFFTPTTANPDHVNFYGSTLERFVENFPIAASVTTRFANVQNFAVVPGIELDNPDPQINNGDISVLTAWNLGAGTSPSNLSYRFNGQAPMITLRAEHNVNVKASLTDGFFQIANPTNPGSSATVFSPSLTDYSDVLNVFNTETGVYGYSLYLTSINPNPYYSNLVSKPVNLIGDMSDNAKEYYALYKAYEDFFFTASPFSGQGGTNLDAFLANGGSAFASFAPPAPQAPSAGQQELHPELYLLYLQQYATYLNQNFPVVQILVPPQPEAVPVISGGTPTTGGSFVSVVVAPQTDNSPSPVAAAGNPLPILAATLTGGPSSTFRIVAGANLASTNPLGLQAAAAVQATQGGNVTLSGQFQALDSTAGVVLVPTMIRTGTGSIDIAAANDLSLYDTTAQQNNSNALVVPGVIYTAGAPSAGGAPAPGDSVTVLEGDVFKGRPDLVVTPTVNPDSAGDISINAQGNINGLENVVDTSGTVTGTAGANISQFWTQWMTTGNVTVPGATAGSTQTVQTSINFGAFDQGVMSVGGNVSINAGGNISNLAVSLPTTWYLGNSSDGSPVVNTVGGGNLSVNAAGNLLGGDYFVAKGTGTIASGGQIGSGFSVVLPTGPVTGVAPLFATQDGVLNVTARSGANVGSVFDPSYLAGGDMQGYSAGSAINVTSITGDVQFGTLDIIAFRSLGGLTQTSAILPPTVDLEALNGGIAVTSGGQLYPSATGNLTLLADQTISFSSVNGQAGATLGSSVVTGVPIFGMLDVDPATMPSPTDPTATVPIAVAVDPASHDATPLHADDFDPITIYSLNGSIVDGVAPQGVGFYNNLVYLSFDKPAMIQAGRDIVNLAFKGQNLRTSDVTRIVAGRDILDTPLPLGGGGAIPGLVLGGPGTFDVEAGRNIGPLTNEQQFVASGAQPITRVPIILGIEAVGNADNPNLPHESANVQVLFGVSPGIAYSAFIDEYVNPAHSVAGVPSSTDALIDFVEQYEAGLDVDTGLEQDKAAALGKVGNLTADQAWSLFKTMPSYVQNLFADQVLFNVLTVVGTDFNQQSSPFFQQYARGYQAINTLFPASFGYTANSLGGGTNGANHLVDTGNLDIRSTTIQTQQGGNVSILGPGGQALVGSTSAPPEIVNSSGGVTAGPGTMGILTLEQGNIDIFTDQSVLLAQSRIFTEQGGGMTIWSSNGDINAGKGAKSSADIPAPIYTCDVNHYCTVDARGEVTGAGIATLQTIPGAAPGDVNLIAPRGTVDAGDAGIRVSGNLNVAALHVANVDNIQVQGKTTGIPVVNAVNTGALTAASSAASAASQMAQDIVKKNAAGVQQRHWIITVQVEGFGDADTDGGNVKKKHKGEPVSYDGSSAVSILGFGTVGDAQRAALSKEEQARLGKI